MRSRRAKAGACQGANCLNSRWVSTALCSDKCLLCFPEKSDLPKLSRLPVFSFALSLPRQTTEFGRLKNRFTCQLKSSPCSYLVVSLPPPTRKLPCSHSGLEATLKREQICSFHHIVVMLGAECAGLSPRVTRWLRPTCFRGLQNGGEARWPSVLSLVQAWGAMWQ